MFAESLSGNRVEILLALLTADNLKADAAARDTSRRFFVTRWLVLR